MVGPVVACVTEEDVGQLVNGNASLATFICQNQPALSRHASNENNADTYGNTYAKTVNDSYAKTANDSNAKTVNRNAYAKTVNNSYGINFKVIICDSRNLRGKRLYCKFYHGNRKHKTSVNSNRFQPFWNEWFLITHLRQSHSPIVKMELWSTSIMGNGLKGFFDIDLTPLLNGRENITDRYFPISGCRGEIRVRLVALSGENAGNVGSSLAVASLEFLGVRDDDRKLAVFVDEIRANFPEIPINVVSKVCQTSNWSKSKANQLLTAMDFRTVNDYFAQTCRPSRAVAVPDPGQGCVATKIMSRACSETPFDNDFGFPKKDSHNEELPFYERRLLFETRANTMQR